MIPLCRMEHFSLIPLCSLYLTLPRHRQRSYSRDQHPCSFLINITRFLTKNCHDPRSRPLFKFRFLHRRLESDMARDIMLLSDGAEISYDFRLKGEFPTPVRIQFE